MPRYIVAFRGISGPGKGGEYVYTVTAADEEIASTKAHAKSSQVLQRINRGNTILDSNPIAIRQF